MLFSLALISLFMKFAPIILLTALVLCGCSKKPLFDSIQANTSVPVKIGKEGLDSVISVTNRDGSSIQGVRIVMKEADGTESIYTAESGTISTSSDDDSAVITLGKTQVIQG